MRLCAQRVLSGSVRGSAYAKQQASSDLRRALASAYDAAGAKTLLGLTSLDAIFPVHT